jgi:hypothetical protein
MSMPRIGTKEWDKEVIFFKLASKEQITKRAEELGILRQTYLSEMNHRGIHRKGSSVLDINHIMDEIDEEINIKEAEEEILFEDTIPKIPKIEIKPLPIEHEDDEESEEVLVALMSDVHGGLKTPTYNSKVFVERLEVYKNAIIKFCTLHRKMRPIKKLVIPMLGDMVQGQQIGVQMLVEECEVIGAEDQIYDLLLPNFTNFAINLLQLFEEIEIYGVEGNHGNIDRRRATLTKKSNWDTVFYRALKASLSQFNRIKVEPELETWWKIIHINGWDFFMAHLDQIVSYQGIPFYGISRKGLRWKQSIPQNFDFMLGGHFHNPNYLYNDGVPVLINGAFISDSDFPLVRMGLRDVPQQICFFVNKKFGISAQYRVQLDLPKSV